MSRAYGTGRTPGDWPVYPEVFRNDGDLNVSGPQGEVVPPGGSVQVPGMTLRQYYAGLAMQGMLADNTWGGHLQACAKDAVAAADALIAELEKPR